MFSEPTAKEAKKLLNALVPHLGRTSLQPDGSSLNGGWVGSARMSCPFLITLAASWEGSEVYYRTLAAHSDFGVHENQTSMLKKWENSKIMDPKVKSEFINCDCAEVFVPPYSLNTLAMKWSRKSGSEVNYHVLVFWSRVELPGATSLYLIRAFWLVAFVLVIKKHVVTRALNRHKLEKNKRNEKRVHQTSQS